MAKKKASKEKEKAKKKDDELPKFGGFHSLAGGLQGFKAQLGAAAKTDTPAQAPPPPPRREAAPPVDALDDELNFHRMMSGVTPLQSAGGARIPTTTDVAPDAQRAKVADVRARAAIEASRALDHLHALVDEKARFEVSDDGRRVEGYRAGTPADLVRSLRRGQLPIDARLDLHGLTAAQAQDALIEFLRAMRTKNERCVLVIHGKGHRHPGAGVLRGEIAAWLAQGKAREHVSAFATARDNDGGEGAVYVALRR